MCHKELLSFVEEALMLKLACWWAYIIEGAFWDLSVTAIDCRKMKEVTQNKFCFWRANIVK